VCPVWAFLPSGLCAPCVSLSHCGVVFRSFSHYNTLLNYLCCGGAFGVPHTIRVTPFRQPVCVVGPVAELAPTAKSLGEWGRCGDAGWSPRLFQHSTLTQFIHPDVRPPIQIHLNPHFVRSPFSAGEERSFEQHVHLLTPQIQALSICFKSPGCAPCFLQRVIPHFSEARASLPAHRCPSFPFTCPRCLSTAGHRGCSCVSYVVHVCLTGAFLCVAVHGPRSFTMRLCPSQWFISHVSNFLRFIPVLCFGVPEWYPLVGILIGVSRGFSLAHRGFFSLGLNFPAGESFLAGFFFFPSPIHTYEFHRPPFPRRGNSTSY